MNDFILLQVVLKLLIGKALFGVETDPVIFTIRPKYEMVFTFRWTEYNAAPEDKIPGMASTRIARVVNSVFDFGSDFEQMATKAAGREGRNFRDWIKFRNGFKNGSAVSTDLGVCKGVDQFTCGKIEISGSIDHDMIVGAFGRLHKFLLVSGSSRTDTDFRCGYGEKRVLIVGKCQPEIFIDSIDYLNRFSSGGKCFIACCDIGKNGCQHGLLGNRLDIGDFGHLFNGDDRIGRVEDAGVQRLDGNFDTIIVVPSVDSSDLAHLLNCFLGERGLVADFLGHVISFLVVESLKISFFEVDTMKRDMRLIRELLFYIEKNSSEYGFIETTNHDVINAFEKIGFSKEAVNYHLSLMHDAGFILGDNPFPLGKQGFWMIQRLTNVGHDFIDTLRDETVWNKFKAQFINEGKDFSLKIATAVAIEAAKQLLI